MEGIILTQKEIEELYKMDNSIELDKQNPIIFDSNKNKWEQKSLFKGANDFNMKIKDKENILILIETGRLQKIGCYISSKITKFDDYIFDKYCYLFQIQNNQIKKFSIVDETKAIKINNEKSEELFIIGDGDIKIKKQQKKDESSMKQKSFDYGVTFNEKEQKFKINHFQIIQMKFTEEGKNKFTNQEMKELEFWSRRRKGNIIFDSDINDWDINTSEFVKKIKNKQHLIFIIETGDEVKFGCYIDSIINNTEQHILDNKSFSNYSNEIY